jgi:hypothetical protein
MNTYLSLLITFTLIAAIGWLLVRIIQADRPVSPPNSPRDWRYDQLGDWRQLWIH